ncbi:MAG: RNA-protein complex protein Nop10 [Nanoarchaeota archaeon]
MNKCPSCGTYTLKEQCRCGAKALPPYPPKYSPEDRYGKYRRMAKRPGLEQQGLVKS